MSHPASPESVVKTITRAERNCEFPASSVSDELRNLISRGNGRSEAVTTETSRDKRAENFSSDFPAQKSGRFFICLAQASVYQLEAIIGIYVFQYLAHVEVGGGRQSRHQSLRQSSRSHRQNLPQLQPAGCLLINILQPSGVSKRDPPLI